MRKVTSFLLIDGHLIAPDLHRARLGLSQRQAHIIGEQLPSTGRWFPKLSFDPETGHVECELRPAPKLRATTTLWVPPYPDPRRYPQCKGPELELQARLRHHAQEQGCDDMVLYSPWGQGHRHGHGQRQGLVRETAHSTLIWFEQGQWWVPEGPRVESVTLGASIRMGLCPRMGILPISRVHEVSLWAGSSLHGWTQVTAVRGARSKPLSAPLLPAAWTVADTNAALWQSAEPW